jgi:hypothetical protein
VSVWTVHYECQIFTAESPSYSERTGSNLHPENKYSNVFVVNPSRAFSKFVFVNHSIIGRDIVSVIKSDIKQMSSHQRLAFFVEATAVSFRMMPLSANFHVLLVC